MSSTLLARIVKDAPFWLIFFSNRSEFCGESDFEICFVRESIDFVVFEEPGNHLDSRLREKLVIADGSNKYSKARYDTSS